MANPVVKRSDKRGRNGYYCVLSGFSIAGFISTGAAFLSHGKYNCDITSIMTA